MTTWELASDTDKQIIRLLIESAMRMGAHVPPLPRSARESDFAGLTKRDAGTLITLLRETLKDVEGQPRPASPPAT